MSELYDAKICVVICTPIPGVRTSNGEVVLDTVSTLWHRARMSLVIPTNFDFVEFNCDKMSVAEARNTAAFECLKRNPQPEFLFFNDSDVILPHDALTKLFFRARCFPEYDVFAGVYCCKHMNPADPLIYRGESRGPFWNWTLGDLLTSDNQGITSTHMGLTLIRVSLFQKMLDMGIASETDPFFKTIGTTHMCPDGFLSESTTEDIYFHGKCQKLGAKVMVDTSVIAKHEDKKTGKVFELPDDAGPVQRAWWLSGKQCDQKALAVGYNNHECKWLAYVAYTLDMRPGTKPDYTQDLRLLNFPNDTFDAVFVKDQIEYFGRYEQEQIWVELMRVLKPGGLMEVTVPDLCWIGDSLSKNLLTDNLLSRLFGPQVRADKGLRFDTYLHGFTDASLKYWAHHMGLINMDFESKDGYMTIKGTKRW